MEQNEIVNKHAEELFSRYPALRKSAENFHYVYSILKNGFFKRKTLFLCGNGGSACDGEHIAGELLKNFILKRAIDGETRKRFEEAGTADMLEKLQPGFRAVSLNNHPGLSSAYANDVDPLMVYAQQLFALGSAGDMLLGISTSGNARNVCNAFKTARGMGITTILMTGENHGICEPYADAVLRAPSLETYKIQEYHLPMYHALCIMLEEEFYGK